MGRRSPSSKRLKRSKQKVKRKLFTEKNKGNAYANHETEDNIHSDVVETTANANHETEDNIHSDVDETTANANHETEDNIHSDVDEITNSCIGEDTDVVLMHTEDSLMDLDSDENAKYSYDYLLECRQKLMHKVAYYRARIEEQSTESAQVAYRHHKEIDQIRSFYQAIAYAPTRAGRMVKASICKSSVASQIMQELGLKYTK